ncbi:hypothetical protein H5410_052249 [Solanum commersonii]|uniref:Serine hydroxymethyltransferase-like domain-containing protein n=1 Tax=Solanum commersonii TaxID=4109 RepID=A0A9J5X328_SOLCO|nr:hypothetical protein H5410_052249 [Solanum commersonii]
MDAFQLFRSISYICPTIELAESLIENESTISIWDPGISPEFMTIIGSTENEEAHTLFEILKQLMGNQLGTARRQDKWMMLSSPFYFVCSIFKKALYNLSPTNNSDWSMILQPYSYSSPVILWGEQVCGLGWKHVGIAASNILCNALLEHIDQDCANTIKLKKTRQWKGLEPSPFVNLMLLFTITYKGEHFDTRYYGGNEYIGMVERPYQSPYLSRGYQNDTKRSFGVSMFSKTMSCKLNVSTGYIDGKQLDKCATWVTPKLVVTNANDFGRQFNYTRLGKVCNKQEFFLLADRAYISGLVASEVICSPFEPAAVVTFATQFMGAKAYIAVVFGSSLLVGVAGSIQDHILYFANIGQFVLATGRYLLAESTKTISKNLFELQLMNIIQWAPTI